MNIQASTIHSAGSEHLWKYKEVSLCLWRYGFVLPCQVSGWSSCEGDKMSNCQMVKTQKLRKSLKSKVFVLAREKPFPVKSLATFCSYMLEMAMRKSTCIQTRRRGSFILKAVASFLVSWLYVLVRIYWI